MAFSIRVTDLVKVYGKVRALAGLSFDIPSTYHRIGVLGRNGAGKSTFLKILVDLLDQDSGAISLKSESGEEYTKVPPFIGTFLSERISVLPTLRGDSFLRLYGELCKSFGVSVDLPLQNQIALELGVTEHLLKYLSQMSKGNQRKIEIVATLSANMPLFIADELTEGLDAPSRLALQELLQKLSNDRQFVVSSHDIGFLAGLVDYVIVIDHGELKGAFPRGSLTVHEFQQKMTDLVRDSK